MMTRDVYIILQKILKIDLKTHKIAKLCVFFFGWLIFVAMATRRMNLRNVLFLNHEIQELLLSNMIRDIYTTLQKLIKIDLKTSKIAKLCNFSSDVCYLLPWQLGI